MRCLSAGGSGVRGRARVWTALLPQIVWNRWGTAPEVIMKQSELVFFFFLSVSNVPSGRTEWQRSLLPDFFSSSWPVDSKLAAELCSRWQSHKDKLPCRSVLNAMHSFPSPDMLHNTVSTDALLLTEILLRWPRLPVETSLPLDFGATPINESKVGSSYDF